MLGKIALLGQKLGMTSLFIGDKLIPVTAIKISKSYVTFVKSESLQDGYNAVSIGSIVSKNINKPQKSYLEKMNLPALNFIREFNNVNPSLFVSGQELKYDLNALVGSFIKVTSTSKGKGFAGAMKRWGFAGHDASHGCSVTHRAHGSTGQRQDPGKVFKGKKMAGRMGGKKVTVLNLKIIMSDSDSSIIFVKGSISGANGSLLVIRDCLHNSSSLINGLDLLSNAS